MSRSSSSQGTRPPWTWQIKIGITLWLKFFAPSGRSLSCAFLHCCFTSFSALTLVNVHDTSFSTLTSACGTSFLALTLTRDYNRTSISNLMSFSWEREHVAHLPRLARFTPFHWTCQRNFLLKCIIFLFHSASSVF
jgi:hypothetical protein